MKYVDSLIYGWPTDTTIFTIQDIFVRNLFFQLLNCGLVKDIYLKQIIDLLHKGHRITEEAILVCWSQFYSKLVFDKNKLIRSLSFTVTILLVKMTNIDQIKPFFSDLVPYLLVGLYDSGRIIRQKRLELLNHVLSNKSINDCFIIYRQEIIDLATDFFQFEEPKNRFPVIHNIILHLLTSVFEICHQRKIILEPLNSIRVIFSDSQTWSTVIKNYSININLTKFVDNAIPNRHPVFVDNKKTSLDLLLNLVTDLHVINYWENNQRCLKIMSEHLFKIFDYYDSLTIHRIENSIPKIINCLNILTDIKDGEIWKNKSWNEKFNNFLHHPLKYPTSDYFKCLYLLFQKSHNLRINIFEKDQWVDIWQTHLSRTKEASTEEELVYGFNKNFWAYYEKFALDIRKNFEPELIESLNIKIKIQEIPKLYELVINYVDGEKLLENIKQFCNDKKQKKYNKEFLFNNITIILNNYKLSKKLSEWLKDSVFKNGVVNINADLSFVLTKMVKLNLKHLLEIQKDIVDSFIVWVNIDNFTLLSKLYVYFLNENLAKMKRGTEKDLMLKGFSKFILISFGENCITSGEIIKMLTNIKFEFIEYCSNDHNLYTVNTLIENYIRCIYDFDDYGKIFHSRILKKHQLITLYDSAESSGKLDLIYKIFPELNSESKLCILLQTNFIGDFFLNRFQDIKLLHQITGYLKASNKLEDNFSRFGDAINILCKTFLNQVYQENEHNPFLFHAANLLVEDIDIFSTKILPKQCNNYLFSIITKVDNRMLLGDKFRKNAFLLEQDFWDKEDLAKIRKLINYGLFIDAVFSEKPNYLNEEIVFFLTIINEILNDFNYISSKPISSELQIKNTYFTLRSTEINIPDIFKCWILNNDYVKDRTLLNTFVLTPWNIGTVIDKRSSHSHFDPKHSRKFNDKVLKLLITPGRNNVVQYYKDLIMCKFLNDEINGIQHISLVDSLKAVKQYVIGLIRDEKTTNQSYLLGSMILSIFTKVKECETIDELKLLLFKYLIGIENTEFMNGKFRVIVLLNSILSLQNTVEAADILSHLITPQMLDTFLKSIEKWLDSSFTNKENSVQVRITLLQLFCRLLKVTQVPDVDMPLVRLAQKMLNDSLNFCQFNNKSYMVVLLNQVVELFNTFNTKNLWTKKETIEKFSIKLIKLNYLDLPSWINNRVIEELYNGLTMHLESTNLLSIYDYMIKSFLEDFDGNIPQNFKLMQILTKLVKTRRQRQIEDFTNIQQLSESENIINEKRNGDREKSELNFPNFLFDYLLDRLPKEIIHKKASLKFLKYLWVWYLALQFLENIPAKMKAIFMETEKEVNLISANLPCLIEKLKIYEEGAECKIDSIKNYNFNEYKLEFKSIDTEIYDLLNYILYQLFTRYKTIVRQWYINIDNWEYQLSISNIMSKKISPLITEDIFNQVEKRKKNLLLDDEEMNIKINYLTNTIFSYHEFDCWKFQIVFNIPEDYPLNNIQITGSCNLKNVEQKWKKWIISIRQSIVFKNITIKEAIKMLSTYINEEFSKFDKCPICYSIIHIADREYLNRTCSRCHYKFHNACLYKWHRLPTPYICPLCKNKISQD